MAHDDDVLLPPPDDVMDIRLKLYKALDEMVCFQREELRKGIADRKVDPAALPEAHFTLLSTHFYDLRKVRKLTGASHENMHLIESTLVGIAANAMACMLELDPEGLVDRLHRFMAGQKGPRIIN